MMNSLEEGKKKKDEGLVRPPLLIYPRGRNTARVKKKKRERERERRRKAAVAHGKNSNLIVYR